MTFKGRYLDIKEAKGSQGEALDKEKNKELAENIPEDCTTLFVKNLPYSFNEDELGQRFRKYGSISSIRLSYNWQTRQFKGFGYVTFEEHSSAKKALIDMNNREIQGRRIKVDFDVNEKPKSGYKTNFSKDGNKLFN